jgi:hypothetical protein
MKPKRQLCNLSQTHGPGDKTRDLLSNAALEHYIDELSAAGRGTAIRIGRHGESI